MLLFVMGPPGRFAEWCSSVALCLGKRVWGGGEIIAANTLEEIARNMLRTGSAHGVVFAYQPSGRMRRALVQARQPFVVALEEPRTVLADLVVRRGLTLAKATQMVAGSCASSLCFSATPGALVLRADRDGLDPMSSATAIARHLQFEVEDREIADVLFGAGAAAPVFKVADAATWWDELDMGERAIAGGALDGYLDLSGAGGFGALIWTPELFGFENQPAERPIGTIDITGRGRHLLRGPHIMLPPGSWSLTATFDFSQDAAEHSFLLDVTAGASLSRTVIHPSGAGVFEADLSVTLPDLPDQPIDLILSSERPAFGGHVTLRHVAVTPRLPTADGTPGQNSRNDP